MSVRLCVCGGWSQLPVVVDRGVALGRGCHVCWVELSCRVPTPHSPRLFPFATTIPPKAKSDRGNLAQFKTNQSGKRERHAYGISSAYRVGVRLRSSSEANGTEQGDAPSQDRLCCSGLRRKGEE